MAAPILEGGGGEGDQGEGGKRGGGRRKYEAGEKRKRKRRRASTALENDAWRSTTDGGKGGEGGEGGREDDSRVGRRMDERLREQQRQHEVEIETLKVGEGGRQ